MNFAIVPCLISPEVETGVGSGRGLDFLDFVFFLGLNSYLSVLGQRHRQCIMPYFNVFCALACTVRVRFRAYYSFPWLASLDSPVFRLELIVFLRLQIA